MQKHKVSARFGSLDDCFVRFEFIVRSLRSCGPLAYSNNECAKQLLYALHDHVWDIKITALEEFADFATLDTEKLFSNLKPHELSRKGRLNHDASLSSIALITSARVSGHDANSTNTTVSFALEFVLSSLAAASDEQYESIPDDEITLLARKFHALHKFCKERKRSPRGYFECGDTTHFIANCPKRKKLDSFNKYNYSTTTITRMTQATRATIGRSTTSETRRRRSRRSYLEHVLS
jgi:hypothetical protein